MKSIQTDRLILRPFQLGDEEGMYQLNRDEEVLRYTGDNSFESVEEAREFLVDYIEYCKKGFGRFAVIHQDTSEFMGFCGLRRQEYGVVDLGFRLMKKYWGRGYATEASLASLDYGFNDLGLDQIIGRVARANEASIKVLKKCGMSYWKDGPCEGIEDSLYYRIFRS